VNPQGEVKETRTRNWDEKQDNTTVKQSYVFKVEERKKKEDEQSHKGNMEGNIGNLTVTDR